MIDSKRIVKNTGFLYVRMLLIMAVTLYTSRVILEVLGADDYGLYNLVGGIVGMLAFLNGTLATTTSRFLTFDIGIGDYKRLKQTFSTAFFSHLALGLIVVLLMETAGLWFILNKAIIPADRLYATLWVFHISVATVLITFTQVPYTSLIMAHEQMKAFAYISLLEAVLKLAIAFLIAVSPIDQLIFYAILMFITQFSIAMIYRYYCYIHWEASHITKNFRNSTLKEMMSFSGWNIIAHCAETLRSQGLVMLFGMFFQPVVIAAQAIATQLSYGITQFTNNFRMAINPQVIKLYASKQYDESRKLTLESSIYVFELFLLIGIPVLLLTEPIMKLWLKEVPEYAALFVCGGQFILAYNLLKCSFSVMWVQYSYIIVSFLFAFIIKPYLLIKDMNYKISEFVNCFGKSFFILVLSSIIPFIVARCVDKESISGFVTVGTISVMNVFVVSWVFLSRELKIKLFMMVKSKFKR